jgi:hypothetical protein
LLVALAARVLVDHGGRWCCVPEPSLKLGKRGALLRGQHRSRVTEIMEAQVGAFADLTGLLPRFEERGRRDGETGL